MSTAVMMERTVEVSPRLKARIAGAFYLLVFLTGGFELAASGGIVVSGNRNISKNVSLHHRAREAEISDIDVLGGPRLGEARLSHWLLLGHD